MKIGFAGFRHDHIQVLYNQAKAHESYEIVAAYEEHAETIEKVKARGVEIKDHDMSQDAIEFRKKLEMEQYKDNETDNK